MSHSSEMPDADSGRTADDEKLIDEFKKKPSSSSPPAGIDLPGFADEEVARKLGNTIGEFLHVFGTILNLE